MSRQTIPLAQRKRDFLFLAFFAVNLVFITYIVDIEQNIIADPYHFIYPAWPPAALVDIIHRYGATFDPLLMARPLWWRMTIWIDTLFFGPFYLAAIYAFVRGREWIRIPSILYASSIMTNVIIILGEEAAGPHAAPYLPLIVGLNLPWLVVPALLIARMASNEHPFSRLSGDLPT